MEPKSGPTNGFGKRANEFLAQKERSRRSGRWFAVFFVAQWCNAAARLAPQFQEVSAKRTDVDFCSIPYEDLQETAEVVDLKVLPSVKLYPPQDDPPIVLGGFDAFAFEKRLPRASGS